MTILFASPTRQAIYEYLHENKQGDRVVVNYRILGNVGNCTPAGARKAIMKMKDEGYLNVLSSGKSGTLIELKGEKK
jgi:hypothetical protein